MPNPYPGGFTELARIVDGLILDCGAGGRRHPGVVGLEYVTHPNNDVQGSVLDLPFRDDTFALVLSQAVLEHVENPQRAVDEMTRVLRPGGLLWLDVAFMQPVHMAPAHFFNHTPFGVLHLCRHLEVVDVGGFGSWVDNWRWIAREMGATSAEVAKVSKVIAGIDDRMTIEQRWNTAPAVHILARKPA